MVLRELLTDFRIPFRERGQSPHVTQGWVGLVCPFCGRGTNKYGCGIHVRTLRVSCWKCGSHRLGDTLAAAADLPLREVLRFLPAVVPESTPSDDRAQGRYSVPDGVEPIGEPHKRYLKSRGFDPDEIVRVWGVQGIGLVGDYCWRLFIPIHHDGKPVSWTTRAIGNRVEKRYLAAPPECESRPLHSCLYGEDKVKHTIAIVEGPVDAWAIGPGAVATCGLTVTSTQMALMSKYPRRLVIFDNEPEAQRRASRLADDLSAMPGETYIVKLSGKDAATTPRDELNQLLREYMD